MFELHGWGETSDTLHQAMAAGDTDTMTAAIADEMLDEYSVTATWGDLADQLLARYDGVVDRIFSYQPAAEWLRSTELTERWRVVAARINQG